MKISKGLGVVLIIIVIIIFIGVGIWVGIHWNGGGMAQPTLSPYSAVYLSTGDIYFGTFILSPSPHMEDAWFLQRGTDAKGNPTENIYPFSQVAWGPSDTVYFNSQQIIFWTRLSATSSVAQLIANPATAGAAEVSPTPTGSTTTP